MSGIYLGNLTLEQIEERTGVQWPEALKDYLRPLHRAKASALAPNTWHCFDIPFTIVCENVELATHINENMRHLAPLFKVPLVLSIRSGA